MKFEDLSKIVYVKDNSYNKVYDDEAFYWLNHENKFYKGYLVHRENGPAIEWANGNKYWFKNGKFHREDGPAIEFLGGHESYYLNDIEYSKEEYWTIINSKKKKEILESIL